MEDTAREMLVLLRQWFGRFGVPEEVTSDGGSQFVYEEARKFFLKWWVKNHITSKFNQHSKLRAESAVKTIKCLFRCNTGHSGNLNTDSF